MTRMKESGIDWIGQIPQGWGVKAIKYIFDEIGSGSTPKSDNEIFYDGDINWIQSGDLYQTDTVTSVSKTISYQGFKSTSALKIYKHPFIALAMYGASVGNVAISCIDACVNQAVVVMLGTSETVRFGKYAIEASKNNLIFSAQGGTQPNISQSLIKNWNIPQPDSSEQTKIADFLDKKTAQLDKAKALLEEQIQKLKDYRASLIYETVTKGLDKTVPMKDSGINWIGQVPEGWDISKIKFTTQLNGRIGWQGLTSAEFKEEGPYLITGTDFHNGTINFETAVHIDEKRWSEALQIQVENGDLLITKDGTVGKVAIISGLDDKASLNSGVLRIQTIDEIDRRFLYYVLLSDEFWMWFNYTNSGASTILHLYQNVFDEFTFTFPQKNEQTKISDLLDKKTVQIDKLIQIKNEQIKNINKQRQTLIYDYVTGKRRV